MYGFQLPPWMQGMAGQGQQGGQPMTPGAGMPPYRNAPMSMTPPQMQPPTAIPGAPPPLAGQPQPGQQPINPAQMGMLSQMLAQQTGKPMMPQGAAGAGAGAALGAPAPGPQGAAAAPAGMDPTQMGMLTQWLKMAGLG